MENNKIDISVEQQFGEVIDIILQHKSRASKAVNAKLLMKSCFKQHGMWEVMFQPN